jgi:hypothetical protein
MEQMRYFGFFYPKDKFADNRDFYKGCLEHPKDAALIGVTEKIAENQLKFYKDFPPEKIHNRLVGHKIAIYDVINPRWSKRGKLVVANGSLEKRFSFDFGEEIKKACESGLKNKKSVTNENLMIDFDSSHYPDTFCYSFDIKRKLINSQNPKEFYVTQYVLIDGKIMSEKKEIARAGFEAKRGLNLPVKFKKLVFAKN